ncbi:M14 family zinc carboxypeptidase [Micromonospora olivasterospora]|uniref:Zinc carboxypeptidase n=1 Tax=Micromonospora olivasterospora TaxID=1880 RepID=A0A562IGQ6_MICOL|nr:M14 family zinc carboxypeptidase [Micromonospora olivasterospora]TWH69915.1 zinc carboxypeptidase [Micromonospora olivasterospora]
MRRSTVIVLSTVLAATLGTVTAPAVALGQPAPAGAAAAEPNQVTNLTVRQGDGYATLAWTPVDGATDYQIERTPVDAGGAAAGPSVVVGVWRPNRQVNNGSPTFADAGFNPGDRFQWRVRAMLVIGYPTPPATPEAVAATSPLAINCNVHGNEPGDREACLIMARQLAFGTDARTIDLLSHSTVLIVPTINGDGRAANTRGNSTGQDLNRDYSLIRQPETAAYVNMLREY